MAFLPAAPEIPFHVLLPGIPENGGRALQDTLRILRRELKRMECWSYVLGVGSSQFVENFQGRSFSQAKTDIIEEPGGLCVLQETPAPYGSELAPKIAP